MQRSRLFLAMTACSAAAIVTGCSDTSVVEEPTDDQALARVSLKSFDNSDAFYDALRSALINQSSGDDIYSTLGTAAESTDGSAGASASDSGAGSGSSSGNDVSSTNVQEAGVDEQDRVKLDADGNLLYVLHTEYDEVHISPEGDTVGSAAASDSQFYNPQTTTFLRILSLDSETPDATVVSELEVDLRDFTANELYLYENGSETSAIVTAFESNNWNAWNSSSYFSESQGMIAKYDVQDAANAQLTTTATIDGRIISSRRIGDTLFFASRYYPQVPDVNYWEEDAQSWREAVEGVDLEDLMPQYYNSGTNQSEPLAVASECFVASGFDEQSYYSPDIISLGVVDLSTMELRDTKCFLGSTETLYASTESVFLATTQVDYSEGPVTDDGIAIDTDVVDFDGDIAWSDPRSTTDIHQFDITGDQLDYRGSGSVSGHLGWSYLQKPFRMSEQDGYLRIATVNDRQGPGHSPILMHVLKANSSGELQLVGSLPNEQRPQHIGEPGETLYASRFLGDKAYMVTFRQTDPLYVIDLADPADPEVKGELKIDGYSNYLHPLDGDLLLGIGKDAVPATEDDFGDGRGAWEQGIKLSLFDVSDPSNPTEIRSQLIGERGTHATALFDHRAINIQNATDSHPTRVSFSVAVHGDAEPVAQASSEPWHWNEYNYKGLHGFDIVTGVNADIVPVGALVIDRASDDPTTSYYYPSTYDDRAVSVNDAVYYISGKDVYPAHWRNLGITPQAR